MDRRFLDLVQAALKAWKGKLDVEFTPPLPLDEILKKVAHLPTKTAILYTNVAADSTGKTFMPRDVVQDDRPDPPMRRSSACMKPCSMTMVSFGGIDLQSRS